MEDYRLEQSGQEVQDILNGAAMQSDLTAETERATEAEQTLQGNIDAEATRAQDAEGTLQDNIDAEEARAKAAEKQNADDIDAIEEKIPSGASSSNKLATEEYVADAVATATATFRGTYNLVSDLHLNVTATEQQIAAALAGAISTADNNDYCFIQVPTSSETPTEIKEIDRYKFNGTAWAFEYKLNNSGFTAAQWAAINSGITSGDVDKLAALPTNAQLTTLLAGLQSDIDGEETRAKAAELALQGNIDAEEARAKAAEKQNADDIDAIEAVIPESASSENKVATKSEIDSLSAAIEAILLLIPSAATSLNKLADKAYVNSSIATATATFRGTYNLVNDLSLTTSATHAQISTALAGAILTADNNDYAFVQIPTSDAMPTEIAKTERYKFNGTAWEYEYDLNNSGFTADQWAAINSGITQALVTKLSDLPTNAQLTTELGTLTSGITTINQKIPNAASQANKLVDTAAMESYIVEVLNVLTISYNVTSTDGHVTFHIEQVDGKITSVTLTTSDIASADALNLKASQADLTALASRVTTAEGNITTLGGRMTTAEGNITTINGNITSLDGRISTNETDIANLQQLYNNLQQSKPVPVTALPETGQQQGVIYRLAGTTSYSDYMWNGSTWVLMATYNNAIDPRPKKASQNLVTSGGVFDNMGALDISELNATENPHTLAQYVDLSAALAAIPTDYQKGGMSIKFVQSSDNKYVQSRCMAQSFTTDVTQWQGVDEEPIAVSRNLVESGGVKNVFNKILANYTKGYKYNSSKQLVEDDNWGISDYIPVNGGQTITFYQGVAIAESMRLMMFNADKTVKDGFMAQTTPRTITLEEGTAFVVLSCYLPTVDKAYIKDTSNNIIWERNDSFEEKIKEGDSLYAYFSSKACPTFDVLSDSIQITLPAGKELKIKNTINNKTYLYSCSASDVYNIGNAHNLVYNIKTGVISIIDYSEGMEDYILLANVSGGTFSGLLLPFVLPKIREQITKLFVSIGQWVHFGDGGIPKITRSGDNINIVFPDNVNMTVYTATTNTYYRHLCTGESFVIGSYQSLLYNTENDTISVVGGNGNNENNILLLGNSHGCIEGHLVKFYYGEFYDNVRDNAFNSAYLDEDIDAKSKAFCALLKGTNDIDTLTFFTDPHLLGGDSTFTDAQKSRFKKFIATLEKYHKSNPLSFVLSGGDWLNSRDTQDIACWKLGYVDGVMRNKFAEYLPVVGNHDTNYWGYINSESTSYDGELTTETIRNLWFRKEGKCYYNYKTKTTSYFVLDTGSEETTVTPYRWEQIDWLANKLLNNTDAHLVVAMHIYSTASSSADWSSHIFPMASSVQSLLTAFNARQSITLNGHTYDFSVSGISGKVACIIAGHTHFDYIDTNGSVPVFCTTNMAETSVPTFDMILLDYTANKLKAIRVGRGDNREMNLA